jgi:hypothetical protein
VVAPFLDRKALEEEEALSIEDIVAKTVKEGAQLGKRELCLYGWVSECFKMEPLPNVQWKHTLVMPVNGVLDWMKASAVSLSSCTSSAVNRCVHFSGLSLNSSPFHTVFPVISLGKVE